DHLLPWSIRGVGLARQHDLDGPLRVREQGGQPPLVVEEEIGPLVGREAPREADGHGIQVELALDLTQDVRRFAVSRKLPRQAAPCTPLVMAMSGWPATCCQVSVAVMAWSWLTALVSAAWRRTNAVMSKGARGSSVFPRPSSRSSPGSHAVSANQGARFLSMSPRSKTSLPAGTGV